MRQTVQRRVRRRKNEYVVRHVLGLTRGDDLPSSALSVRSTFNPLPGTIMLSRTLLSPHPLSRRPGQLATRTHLTAAWQAKPTSGVLQMFSPSRSWNATHRGQTSAGHGSFNAPKPPRFGFWQRISQRINRIPSGVVFWGIFGINGAIFALWQVANTQYVSRGPLLQILRQMADMLSGPVSNSQEILPY